MKRTILIISAAVVLLLLAVVGPAVYGSVINPQSPKAEARGTLDGVEVSVRYSRPSKKGRVLFADDGLVPHGKYWRLGANAATEITFGGPVLFAGAPVKAGTYRMYAVPGPSSWKVVLNSELGQWGAVEADHAKDVVTVEVPVERTPAPEETFLITVEPALSFAWDTVKVTVPVSRGG